MKKLTNGKKILALSLVLLCVGSSWGFGQTFKMASPLARNTPWGRSIDKLAQKWEEVSGGKLTLKVYPDGVMGTDSDVIRKLRIGHLDAAILSGPGLGAIATPLVTVSLPFFIENDEELAFVLKEIFPDFQKIVRKKGFELLAIAESGWSYLFARKAISLPEELKKVPLAVSTLPPIVDTFRALGFRVLPLESRGGDLQVAVQSGMVDALYAVPLAVASSQLFALLPHMYALPVLPVFGGLVVTNRTWRRLDKNLQKRLLPAVHQMIDEFRKSFPNLEAQAMKTMLEHGLKIHQPLPGEREKWVEIFQKKAYGNILNDDDIPVAFFNKIQRNLDSYRAFRQR